MYEEKRAERLSFFLFQFVNFFTNKNLDVITSRNIFLDFYKKYFEYVGNNKSEWCIIDFGNIRHNLLKITRIHDGAYQYVTVSNESKKSVELLKQKLSNNDKYIFEDEL